MGMNVKVKLKLGELKLFIKRLHILVFLKHRTQLTEILPVCYAGIGHLEKIKFVFVFIKQFRECLNLTGGDTLTGEIFFGDSNSLVNGALR